VAAQPGVIGRKALTAMSDLFTKVAGADLIRTAKRRLSQLFKFYKIFARSLPSDVGGCCIREAQNKWKFVTSYYVTNDFDWCLGLIVMAMNACNVWPDTGFRGHDLYRQHLS
jgi:hypothetical protein